MNHYSNYLLVSNVSDASFAIGVAHACSQKIDISDIVGLKTFVNSEFCPRFLLDDPTEENLGFGLQGKSVYILSTSSAHYTRMNWRCAIVYSLQPPKKMELNLLP